MPSGSSDTPRVFISYSWTTPAHEDRVRLFAERLTGDGIHVVFDKWDLKEGQDKHVFMEQMVADLSIKKVLVICDRAYQVKADSRSGGVGTETQLISKEVYEKTDQQRFIPIVWELGQDGSPCVPVYMASRIHIDLSSDEHYEENYQKLIRNLYDKPLLRRPPLGSQPPYLDDDNRRIPSESRRVNELKQALLSGRLSANGLIDDYLRNFRGSLEQFRIGGQQTADFDERVLASIDQMGPLRDEFIEFTKVVFAYNPDVDLGTFQDFFESLIVLGDRPATIKQFTERDFDNYRVFNYELILYFMTVLLELKKYREFGFFANSFYLYEKLWSKEVQSGSLGMLNRYAESLDVVRNNRLNLNRVSVTADLIKSRATRQDITFDKIQEADLILYYVSELSDADPMWFPRTSAYPTPGNKLLARMASRKQFERLKPIFNVETDTELKRKIEEYKNQPKSRPLPVNWDYEISPLAAVLDPKKIATLK